MDLSPNNEDIVDYIIGMQGRDLAYIVYSYAILCIGSDLCYFWMGA